MVAQLLPTHPVVGCVERATEAITESLTFEPVYMSTDAKRAALLAIAEHERRLAGLKLRVMAASADVADADGARDVAAWLASRTRAEVRPLRQEQKLAQALDERWPRVAAGMVEGVVSVEQAHVIVKGPRSAPGPPRPGGDRTCAGAPGRAREGPQRHRAADPGPPPPRHRRS